MPNVIVFKKIKTPQAQNSSSSIGSNAIVEEGAKQFMKFGAKIKASYESQQQPAPQYDIQQQSLPLKKAIPIGMKIKRATAIKNPGVQPVAAAR